jgi:hypothetical protein
MIFHEQDDRFYIGQSTIKNAGFGLFCSINIEQNDYLIIKGIKVAKNSVADLCTHYCNKYKFSPSVDDPYNIIPLGFAGMVNHAIKKEDQNVMMAWLEADVKSMIWLFTKPVAKGEEILGDYGDNWAWKHELTS